MFVCGLLEKGQVAIFFATEKNIGGKHGTRSFSFPFDLGFNLCWPYKQLSSVFPGSVRSNAAFPTMTLQTDERKHVIASNVALCNSVKTIFQINKMTEFNVDLF